MANLESLKHSIQNLNSFIKERACEGSTFENQAIFNILARDFGHEVIKARQAGLSADELAELLREENRGMSDYREFVGTLKSAFYASSKGITLN